MVQVVDSIYIFINMVISRHFWIVNKLIRYTKSGTKQQTFKAAPEIKSEFKLIFKICSQLKNLTYFKESQKTMMEFFLPFSLVNIWLAFKSIEIDCFSILVLQANQFLTMTNNTP